MKICWTCEKRLKQDRDGFEFGLSTMVSYGCQMHLEEDHCIKRFAQYLHEMYHNGDDGYCCAQCNGDDEEVVSFESLD